MKEFCLPTFVIKTGLLKIVEYQMKYLDPSHLFGILFIYFVKTSLMQMSLIVGAR